MLQDFVKSIFWTPSDCSSRDLALRSQTAVTGKFPRRNRGADIIDLFASGERAVKRDADYCAPMLLAKQRQAGGSLL